MFLLPSRRGPLYREPPGSSGGCWDPGLACVARRASFSRASAAASSLRAAAAAAFAASLADCVGPAPKENVNVSWVDGSWQARREEYGRIDPK
jgi:hypothetical protein